MIQNRTEIHNEPLLQMQRWLDNFSDVTLDLGRETFREVQPHLLDELTHIPGSPVYPIRWTSEKQRRFVMAKLRRENNLPYQRTGQLAAGWEVLFVETKDGFDMKTRHADPVAKFVYGSFDRRRQFKQRFHSDTGWPDAAATVDFWNEAFVEGYTDRFNRYIRDDLGRFTEVRRNR